MLRKTYLLPLLIAVAVFSGLGVVSCTSTADAPETSPVPVGPVAPAGQYDGRQVTERGSIAKEFGETAGLTSSLGAVVMDFVVTNPRAATCDEPDVTPQHGRFVAVDVAITTHDDPEGLLRQVFIANGWEFVGADGSSVKASTFDAATCEYPEGELRPNRTYQHTVVLDVPKAPGVAVFDPGNGGWEWKLAV